MIVKNYKIPSIDITEYADIDRFQYKFKKVYDHSKKEDDSEDCNQVFRWDNGQLTNIHMDGDELSYEDCLYIHLQKRNMENQLKSDDNKYYIVPNSFINTTISEKDIIEKYSIDKNYNEMKIFKKECLLQKFTLEYWNMKKTMFIIKNSK